MLRNVVCVLYTACVCECVCLIDTVYIHGESCELGIVLNGHLSLINTVEVILSDTSAGLGKNVKKMAVWTENYSLEA